MNRHGFLRAGSGAAALLMESRPRRKKGVDGVRTSREVIDSGSDRPALGNAGHLCQTADPPHSHSNRAERQWTPEPNLEGCTASRFQPYEFNVQVVWKLEDRGKSCHPSSKGQGRTRHRGMVAPKSVKTRTRSHEDEISKHTSINPLVPSRIKNALSFF